MEKTLLSVPDQIKVALDGRTQRWLSFEIRMPETDLSKKMNGEAEFTDEEIEKINNRLNAKVKKH